MQSELRLIIVSGLSGSGKSVALHVLEDLGYYCIDNLPAGLLISAVEEVRSSSGSSMRLAVGVDARNHAENLDVLPDLLRELRTQGIETDIIFLHASDETLLQRYRESRRRHPLAELGMQLRAAIESERAILAEIELSADLIIDTSATSIARGPARDRLPVRARRVLRVQVRHSRRRRLRVRPAQPAQSLLDDKTARLYGPRCGSADLSRRARPVWRDV